MTGEVFGKTSKARLGEDRRALGDVIGLIRAVSNGVGVHALALAPGANVTRRSVWNDVGNWTDW